VAVRDKPAHDPDKAKNLYKKGNALIRKRKYKDAVKFFRQALRADPRFALAHRGLGICYAQLRKNKAACKSYRLYLKMIPPDSKEVPALKQILKSCK
jgi:Flp pilus assembly protein TadD